MDKYEYKVRSEEIRELVEEKNYKEAAEIADTIDWRRVKSIKMLCTISDVYKMVRRYEDSKALLLLADEKRPGSRMIIYALTELCLKLGDVVSAWEYYKEFCRIAPNDSNRYILLYKVYAAQEVGLEEQISVLEKLKEEDYTDRWGYELAYLYHRIGFATKCVEECNEMILYFGEGKYVRKAMELKMLHEPLTAEQQALYNGERRQEIENGETKAIPNLDAAIMKEVSNLDPDMAPTIKLPTEELADIQIKTVDDSPYNTINLQKALAESMAELMDSEAVPEEAPEEIVQEEELYDANEPEEIENTGEVFFAEEPEEEEEESRDAAITRRLMAPMLEETQEMPNLPDMEEVFFEDPNTTDLSAVIKETSLEEPKEEEKPQAPTYETASESAGIKKVIVPTAPENGVLKAPKQMMRPTDFAGQKSGFDEILSQESDGQISLVMPEKEKIEKQITGQMSIQDILQEWEQMKKNQSAQLENDVKQHVLAQTGELFAEFEKSKDTLFNELEKAAQDAIKKEEEKAELSENIQEENPEEEYESAAEAEAEPEEAEVLKEAVPEPKKEEKAEEPKRASVHDRTLSPEEKELFESFIQSRHSKEQLLQMLDNLSLAAYTGNVLISGERDAGVMKFARNVIRIMQISDGNFSGKAAKITGTALNKKDVAGIVDKLNNGALIVEEAGGLNCSTAEALVKSLQSENKGIIVMLVDTKGGINSLLEVNEVLRDTFNARFDVEALNDGSLVAYGKKFAYDKEYAIDEMGVLALHTRIADMQTAEHAVTVADVRTLVKQAIRHADKKTPKHFFDLLVGKRYDKEDMIILREEDFFYYE